MLYQQKKRRVTLLNNLDSWKNNGTNFKVFNEVYLLGNELNGNDEINDSGTGLKCNISFYEGISNDSKLCTDAAIRYCFWIKYYQH